MGWLGLLGGTVAALFVLRRQRGALAGEFGLDRVFGYGAEEESPGWMPAETAAPDAAAANDEPLAPAAPPAPVDEEALTAALHRALGQPAGEAFFRRGFIERCITRVLSPRQRVLVDFLQPQSFGWTRSWLVALALVVAGRLFQGGGICRHPARCRGARRRGHFRAAAVGRQLARL